MAENHLKTTCPPSLSTPPTLGRGNPAVARPVFPVRYFGRQISWEKGRDWQVFLFPGAWLLVLRVSRIVRHGRDHQKLFRRGTGSPGDAIEFPYVLFELVARVWRPSSAGSSVGSGRKSERTIAKTGLRRRPKRTLREARGRLRMSHQEIWRGRTRSGGYSTL